jgi:hypothetical protein
MKKQTKSKRMDEYLGMKRGKESNKSQSMTSRRHESEEMHGADHHMKHLKHHMKELHKMAMHHKGK